MSEKKKVRNKLLRAGLFAVLLAVDVLSKWLARRVGVFEENRGVAFGFFEGVDLFVVWLVVLLVVGGMYVKDKTMEWWWLGLGGLANLVDRLMWGAVTDWIRLVMMPWWFNLADVYINVGVVVFLFGYLCEDKQGV